MSIPEANTFTFSTHGVQFDVYLPASVGKLPTLIIFRGGGMTPGSKSDVTVSHSAWLIGKAQERFPDDFLADYNIV
jgi:acetyl esterase/lipase